MNLTILFLPEWMDGAWLTAASIGFFGSLAISFTLWWFDSPTTRIRRYVDSTHPEDRKYIKAILGAAPPSTRYTLIIQALNERLQLWFGERWSLKAFYRCLQLAFIYPILFLVCTLLLRGDLGRSAIGYMVLTFLILGALAAVFAGPELRVRLPRLRTAIRGKVGGYDRAISLVLHVLTAGLGAVLAYGFVLLVSIHWPEVLEYVELLIVVFLFSFGVIYSNSFLIAFAICAVACGTAVLASIAWINAPLAVAMNLMFAAFILLPVLNAGFDWLSWGVTRFFLAKMARVESGFRGVALLAVEILADFLAAILLLIGLMVAFAVATELANAAFAQADSDRLGWQSILQGFEQAPWKDGFFVTAMLLTTLVPTFLHLMVALAGAFFSWPSDTRRLGARVPYDPARAVQEELSVGFKDEIVSRVRYVRFWYVPAGVAVALAMYGAVWLLNVGNEPLGRSLARAGYCGGALLNRQAAQCPWWGDPPCPRAAEKPQC